MEETEYPFLPFKLNIVNCAQNSYMLYFVCVELRIFERGIKMFKKVLVLILSILMAGIFCLTIIASNNPTFLVDTKEANAGDKVEINISIKNNPGLASAKFYVTYDKDLSLESVSYGNIGGMTMQPQSLTSNPVILNWFSALSELKGDKVYATLTFKVPSSPKKTSYPITIKYNQNDVFNIDEEDIYFEIVNGAINIKGIETTQTQTSQETTKKIVTTQVTKETITTQVTSQIVTTQVTKETFTTQTTKEPVTTQVTKAEITTQTEEQLNTTSIDIPSTTYIEPVITTIYPETIVASEETSIETTQTSKTEIETKIDNSSTTQTTSETESEISNKKDSKGIVITLILIGVLLIGCIVVVIFVVKKSKK